MLQTLDNKVYNDRKKFKEYKYFSLKTCKVNMLADLYLIKVQKSESGSLNMTNSGQ